MWVKLLLLLLPVLRSLGSTTVEEEEAADNSLAAISNDIKPIGSLPCTSERNKTLTLFVVGEEDLDLDGGVGVCGKDGQSVPVGVGQPTLKVDEIVVGGTAT